MFATQEASSNDLAVLLGSGFEAVSTSRASEPLGPPSIRDVLNGNTGQIILCVTPIAGARAFEARCAVAPAGGVQGLWQSGGLFTNSRSIPVNGLTPGANYNFQVRAIGGATGYSDWSDPVGHMSM